MVKMYKLVNQNYETHSGMKWEIGKTNRATGVGNRMCTNQVLHCYASPEQAVLFNSRHANISNPILLEIECSSIVATDGLKYASKEQTPLKLVPLPIISRNQKIAIAIKAALIVYKAGEFVLWANNWLSGTDRTTTSARAAAYAAAAYAAYAAAYAAAAYDAADAAAYAAYAADAAAYAAYAAAAAAAYDAADAARFGKLLNEAIEWVMENI